MTKIKHSVTVQGKDAKNPVADNAANIENGRVAFSHYCAACHGLDGQNSGVPFADRMEPPVPALNSREVQSYADGQLKWIIDNGISPSGMPASSGILTDSEIWSIVVYIRHLPPAGSLGEPAMYSGRNCRGATDVRGSEMIIQGTHTAATNGIVGDIEFVAEIASHRTVNDGVQSCAA
jgi:cytochrome c